MKIYDFRKKGIFFSVLCLLFFIQKPINAQDGLRVANLPDEIYEKREQQRELASQKGIEIIQWDEGLRSSTLLKEVPVELFDPTIRNSRDLESVIELFYPYYGFGNTESLRLVNSTQEGEHTVYTLQQYIEDIPSVITLDVWVNNNNFQIVELSGGLVMDRGFERDHRFTEDEAIKLVLNELEKKEQLNRINTHGQHFAELFYKQFGEDGALSLWWKVFIETKESVSLPDGSQDSYRIYHVSPDGSVYDTSEAGTYNASSINVCDGSSQQSPWCDSSSNPLVIDSSGGCMPGYSCSGSNNQYQVPYDAAADVEVMWEDIFGPGCCDLGDTNTAQGGKIHINVGGDTGAYDGHFQYHKLPGGYTRSVVVLDPNAADDPTVTAHELGHGYHALKKDSTYGLTGTSPVGAKREYEALVEFIADAHAVIFQNYNGPSANPKFSNIPDFVTPSGYDYSQPFDISDISPVQTPYENAQVGGHAMYELIQNQNVDFELAAKLFFNSLPFLQDDDSNGWISFQEFRDAMLDAANLMGASNAIKNAIKDAWHDAGVGAASGSGGSGMSPPSSTPPGAPNPPINLNASLYRACYDGKSDYNISFNHSSGATHYNIWHSAGIGWSFTGTTYSSPVLVWTTIDADLKVSACNANGCSVLSTSTTSVDALCN